MHVLGNAMGEKGAFKWYKQEMQTDTIKGL